MSFRSLFLAAMAAAVLACQNASAPPAPLQPAPARVIRANNSPPSAKDIINAAFESATVPLSIDESCRNVGTDSTDATLGRYLGGFIAELNPESGKNGLVTSVREAPEGWICRLMVQRRAGEEVWSWGVEFEFGKDGVLKPESYRCVGAG